MKDLWQTAVIFISSTFKDMQLERDLINRVLVPALNEYFSRFRIRVRLIDMRWGINTENVGEEEREQYILDVCLREIDRSRPFFLGLLGHRYGWVPSEKQLSEYTSQLGLTHPVSVTELEILYGSFLESSARSVFCFRNRIENLPGHATSIYIEEEPVRKRAIESLRKSIREKLLIDGNPENLLEYTAEWNGNYAEPEEGFIEQLIRILTEKISTEFGVADEHDPQDLDAYHILESMMDAHRYDIEANTIKRELIDAQLLKSSRIICIEGESRSGKSVLLAQEARELEEIEGILPIYYSTLADTECRDPMTMLNYFGYKMTKSLGEKWEEISGEYRNETMIFGTQVQVNNAFPVLERKLTELCSRLVSEGRLPVFLIDSFDQLIGERYDSILPLGDCDSAAIVFVSADDKERGCTDRFRSSNYSEADADAIISSTLGMESKDIHASVRNMLKAKSKRDDGTYSVGWLSMALYWMKNLNADDFAAISRNAAAGDERKMEQYFIELVNDMPADEGGLFREFALKNGKVFSEEMVNTAIIALSLSPFGIAERELAALSGAHWDELSFARFRRWFGHFVSESPGLRSWHLRSDSIRESLKNGLKGEAQEFHSKMSEILDVLPPDDPVRRRDLPFHLLASGNYSRLASIIVNAKKYMVEDFAMAMSLFTVEERIQAGYAIMKACDADRRPEALAFIILMLYLRNDMIPKDKVIDFAADMERLLPAELYAGNEYSLTCLSTVWSELSLLAKYNGSTEQQLLLAEALINVGRTKYRHYKSFDSKQSLYKGIMALSAFYMECGEFDRCMELYSELAELSDAD